MGFVCTIVESQADQDAWGFEEPHILLSSHHPYDPEDSGYVAYSNSDFEDEGIERLSGSDEEEFERAVSLASSIDGFAHPFHIGLDILSEDNGSWIFSSLQGGELREFTRISRRK